MLPPPPRRSHGATPGSKLVCGAQRLSVIRSIRVSCVASILEEGERARRGRTKKALGWDGERHEGGEGDGGASSPCRGVLRRTIKPCRLRGGVMGSPKVNLTAYDPLYLPLLLTPPLSPRRRDFSLFSTLQRPSVSLPFSPPPLVVLPRDSPPPSRYLRRSIATRTADCWWLSIRLNLTFINLQSTIMVDIVRLARLTLPRAN